MNLKRPMGIAMFATLPSMAFAAPYQLSHAEIVLVQNGVRDSLKDPESARFGPMAAGKVRFDEGDSIFVCGYYNAKNSFGGYVGRQMYGGLLTKAAFEIALLASSAGDQADMRDRCAENGAVLPE